jgi:Flp pilus assembly protein TadB
VILVGALAAATCAVALCAATLVRVPAAIGLRIRHPDEALLADGGWRRGTRSWIGVQLSVAAVAAATVPILGLPALLIPAVAALPSVWIRMRATSARDRARRALTGIVVTAEAALRSGSSLPEALRRAADSSTEPSAARPVHDAVDAFDLGASLDAALLAAAASSADPRSRLALATLALGIAERLPRERTADLLGSLGERLTFEDRLADEIRARAAGARQQQRLLAALVPGLALYLAVTMPVLSTTLSSDLGRFVLIPVAAALEVIGIVLGRRVVAGALR